ncbi:MAG: zinc-dependent alcohol dehydrogenase [Candidatus Thorarchaeota archaeon]|jgi:2-desacetyl-2-hydroxyethyl bacteriochlorophyllide A dehydrogenase
MKAGILYGPKDLRIEEIDIPKPKPGWVLLKIRAAGICGSDLHLYKEKTFIPISSELGEGIYVPGHELAGEVHDIGPDVLNLNKGDRVVVEPTVNCGKCKWCKNGWYHLCENSGLIGFYYIGGLAEYCLAPEAKCFKLSDETSFEEAATLDCIAVAEHAVNQAEISTEDTVAIFGAGTIGLFAAQAALVAGAREVYVTGTHTFQIKAAERYGITSAINVRKENPVEKIMELTSSKGVDKVIEAVGGEAPVIDEGISVLRRRGTLVATGIFLKPVPINMFSLLTKEIVLTGAWGYGYWTHLKEFEVSLNLLESGRIDAKSLITHRFPLKDASNAFEVALDKKNSESIKVQIVID